MNSYPYKAGDKVEIVDSPYKRIPHGSIGTIESVCGASGAIYGMDVQGLMPITLFFQPRAVQPFPLLEVPENL